MEHLLAGHYQAVWGFAVRQRAGSDGRSGAKWVTGEGSLTLGGSFFFAASGSSSDSLSSESETECRHRVIRKHKLPKVVI